MLNSLLKFLPRGGIRIGFMFTLLLGLGLPQSLRAQCALACNKKLNISLDETCQALITYDMILEGEEAPQTCSPNNPESFLVELRLSPNAQPFPEPIVTIENLGQRVLAKVIHLPSGNSCSGELWINDELPPGLDCPEDIVIECGESTAPNNTGLPEITECLEFELTFEDKFEDLSMMCDETIARITRFFRVTNENGQTSTCSQTIELLRQDIDDVFFPLDRDGITAPVEDCADFDTSPENTGYPRINGSPIEEDKGLCGFSVSYEDEILDACGSTFIVVRTWTVVDPCTGEVRRDDQIINVKDSEEPSVSCPDTLFAGIENSEECFDDIVLPGLNYSDNCSPNDQITVNIITPFGLFNGNGATIPNVGVGCYDIMYMITDECGNAAMCNVVLCVEDEAPPVMICDDDVQISLPSSGMAQVEAEILAGESYDNCCGPDFDVKRMGEPDVLFRPAVKVDCDDIGDDDLMVIVRGTDCYGNTNFCMVRLIVSNKLNPTIECPDDITILCTDDPDDLNITGFPETGDACGGDPEFDYTDIPDLNNCGVGTITRIFSISTGDQTVSCTQIITVIDETEIEVTCPPDYVLEDCFSPSDYLPENLPPPFNRPIVEGDECEDIFVGFDDLILTDIDEADGDSICIKIQRTWTIIDWCVYDPSDPNSEGIWTCIQLIKIEDDQAPIFDCPDNLEYLVGDGTCEALVILPDPELIEECVPDLVDIDISGDFDQLVNPNVPIGMYEVIYTATDNCGNSSTCTIKVSVRDTVPPEANCIKSILLILDENGETEIWASDTDAGHFDFCTPKDSLLFRMGPPASPNDTIPPDTDAEFYTCADTGVFVRTIWVGDQSGNWDKCDIFLTVLDEDGVCEDGGAMLAGVITNEAGEEVENVMVSVMNDSLHPAMSKSDGHFTFPYLRVGRNYDLSPEKNDDFRNGVSTLDIIHLNRHILGVNPITSPYQLIAADINRSGTISTLDMIELRKLILNRITRFENNSSWRFIPKAYAFQDPANPFREGFPEYLTVESFSAPKYNADFIGIKIGDLNRSAQPSSTIVRSGENSQSTFLQLEDQYLEAGATYSIPVKQKGSEAILGWQMAFLYHSDRIEFMQTVAGMEGMATDFEVIPAADRMTVIGFENSSNRKVKSSTTLFYLRVKALRNGWLSEALQPEYRGLDPEIYVQSGSEIIERTVDFEFIQLDGAELGIRLGSAYPNPFQEELIIPFQLAQEDQVYLEVWDLNGRLILRRRQDMAAGQQQFIIDAQELQQEGLYIFRLRGRSGEVQGRAIYLR